MPKNIALVGAAPSSRMLAPFNDPDWEIWTCCCRNTDLPRHDVWFELHSMARMGSDAKYTLYLAFLQTSRKVYMQSHDHRIPNSVALPREEIDKFFFGHLRDIGIDLHFFTSTPAWMTALAIMQKPESIGFWGMDMNAEDEYTIQRPGVHFFINEMAKLGIKPHVPPESDLGDPFPVYGYKENDPMHYKLKIRRQEIEEHLRKAEDQHREAVAKMNAYTGARDTLDQIIRTYGGRG